MSTLYEIEMDAIIETLRQCNGNRLAAAKLLGITERTIRTKLSQYCVDAKTKELIEQIDKSKTLRMESGVELPMQRWEKLRG